MIFLMTKDSFLLQGFWQLKDNHEMIKINSLSEIKKVGNKPFKVIIDTYHNQAYGCDVVLLCLQLVCDSDHGSKATFFHFLYIYPVCP